MIKSVLYNEYLQKIRAHFLYYNGKEWMLILTFKVF